MGHGLCESPSTSTLELLHLLMKPKVGDVLFPHLGLRKKGSGQRRVEFSRDQDKGRGMVVGALKE